MMADGTTSATPQKAVVPPEARPQRVVLVLQGGGALGAYQAGVYEAMHEAGIMPDWVIGTSIGAINAALIVGNAPENRVARMKDFWKRVEHDPIVGALGAMPWVGPQLASMATMASGLPAFFRPNPLAFLGANWPLGAERAAYYSTDALRGTLNELIDFERINAGPCRLTVGAANLRTAEMRYFDSRDMAFDVRHVMASGALPPGFPAVRIDGELYWDGGILSNTPVEAVFDDNPRCSAVVFVVHIWNPSGPEPDTLPQVMNRMKDVQYSSRARSHVARQKQLHRLRHVIAELSARLPEEDRARPEVKEMAAYGCLTQMHIVRLLAPELAGATHLKDIDFSPSGIADRWKAGYAHTAEVLALAPWTETVGPLEGLILHEAASGRMVGPAR
jgi:NTE family protein